MLTEFKSMWDGLFGRIDFAKHRIDLINDKVSLVHSTQYRAGPTARQFGAVGLYKSLAEKVIELATT